MRFAELGEIDDLALFFHHRPSILIRGSFRAVTFHGYNPWRIGSGGVIPASVHRLAAAAGSGGSKDLPADAIQGRADFGCSHYGGPCPPVGDHAPHYEITIYALKVPSLPLDGTASADQVGLSLDANTLATAKIVGRYGRSQ
jgi:Raf kinase inhibitor-like YbhB/YbcL family protein